MSKLDDYTFDNHPLFESEFNKIIRKHQCPTLKEDFERLKLALVQNLEEFNQFPVSLCNRISGLNSNVKFPAFIVKNFRCKGIKRVTFRF